MHGIDLHSHILPNIDDGSESVSESVKMLDMLASQNIKTVVATPHFYAERRSVDEFLEKRARAYDDLKDSLTDAHPEILLGAEVCYYEGISRLESLDKLCIEKSKLLLLEMPCSKWSDFAIKEILQISCSNITVVLAHIERYMKYQSNIVLASLSANGILMQANAGFFNSLLTRKRALDMLKNGAIRFIGSDCHGIKNRPADIGNAYSVIERRMGSRFLESYFEYVDSYFEK